MQIWARDSLSQLLQGFPRHLPWGQGPLPSLTQALSLPLPRARGPGGRVRFYSVWAQLEHGTSALNRSPGPPAPQEVPAPSQGASASLPPSSSFLRGQVSTEALRGLLTSPPKEMGQGHQGDPARCHSGIWPAQAGSPSRGGDSVPSLLRQLPSGRVPPPRDFQCQAGLWNPGLPLRTKRPSHVPPGEWPGPK